MRLVTKINCALAGILAISAVIDFVALDLTIMPGFVRLENETASRNQMRAIEAIRLEEKQVASSTRDYAFWDDTLAFMEGRDQGYEAENTNAEGLKALGVNYVFAIDGTGAVKLNKGFDFSSGEARPIRLSEATALPADHPFRHAFDGPLAQTGLVRTPDGLAAVGYAPILSSQRTGAGHGTLLFGKLLDLDALRSTTRVDFDLVPVSPDAVVKQDIVRTPETVAMNMILKGIDGAPIALMTSRMDRSITSAGGKAIWAGLTLLLLGGLVLIATLSFVLRRIALGRIETMRRHMVAVADSGSLEPLPDDGRRDELGDMVGSFNLMAGQLAQLRDALRRQDYHHGAADQAAGSLHNIRNAISPIATIAWDLTRAEEEPWKANLGLALRQLDEPGLTPERAAKLHRFIALSTGRWLTEGEKRRTDLKALDAILRHIDGILRDQDAAAEGERVSERIPVAALVSNASHLVARRPGIVFTASIAAGAAVEGHRIALEQVLGNLLVNAADSIEAAGREHGTIVVTVSSIAHSDGAGLDIAIADNGDGIRPDRLAAIFEKGFSTRRARSSGLGLHWCANAVNAMGGRLHAESDGPGQGATLHITLPCPAIDVRRAA